MDCEKIIKIIQFWRKIRVMAKLYLNNREFDQQSLKTVCKIEKREKPTCRPVDTDLMSFSGMAIWSLAKPTFTTMAMAMACLNAVISIFPSILFVPWSKKGKERGVKFSPERRENDQLYTEEFGNRSHRHQFLFTGLIEENQAVHGPDLWQIGDDDQVRPGTETNNEYSIICMIILYEKRALRLIIKAEFFNEGEKIGQPGKVEGAFIVHAHTLANTAKKGDTPPFTIKSVTVKKIMINDENCICVTLNETEV